MATVRIFGGPGTGKTTVLIDEMRQALQDEDLRICYLTYSKVMAKEARERSGLPPRAENGKVAGTLHSVYSQLLGFTKTDFLGKQSVQNFFDKRGIELYQGEVDIQDDVVMTSGISVGAKILSEFDAHQQAYRNLLPVDGYDGSISKLFESYQNMKGDLKDYTDILVDARDRAISPEANLLLLDEFQDLTALMYAIILEAEKDADRTLIGGDDDQCIYSYRGCDPAFMISHPGEEKILPWSHRCSSEILNSANAVLKAIPERLRKVKEIGADPGGKVLDVGHISHAIEAEKKEEGTCYILARTNKMAIRAGAHLQEQGLAYGAINPRHWNAITPWNKRTRLINNALAHHHNGVEPSPEEKRALILSIPAVLMHRGTKTQVKKGDMDLEKPLASVFTKVRTTRELVGKTNLSPRSHRAIWDRGFTLLEGMKFFVDTKHASKGKEADAVVSLQDIPKVVQESIKLDPKGAHEEARLEYVARTRARKRLYLCNLKGWL